MQELGICKVKDDDKYIHYYADTRARRTESCCGKPIRSFPHEWAYTEYGYYRTRKEPSDLIKKIDELAESEWKKPMCPECEKWFETYDMLSF